MKSAEFEVPFDIPVGNRAVDNLKKYLTSLNIPQFGKGGEPVGLGYEWHTRKGTTVNNTVATCRLAKRLYRALWRVGAIAKFADCYNLTQRVIYIQEGEPYVKITLQEG